MTSTVTSTVTRTDPLPARLQQIAGWSLIAICAVHIALFATLSRQVAAGWLLGDFRNGTGTLESESLFWALPGGFALPMLVLAGVLISLARRRVVIPWFVGYGLAVWVAINVTIVPASGFVAGAIPCVLLIWADVLDRRSRRARLLRV